MKSAGFDGAGKPLKIVEAALPAVPAEGALIKTTYSGVCHSDVHFRKGGIDLGGGQVHSPHKIHGDKYMGTVFGHEVCGKVVALGERSMESEKELHVGDNVIIYPWVGCEECQVCNLGLNNKCTRPADIGLHPLKPGGYATHVLVNKCRHLIKVPDGLPMSIACMLPCSGATAYASLLRARKEIEQGIYERGQANLLVVGAGGLGLWCVQLAKKAVFTDKAVNVIVADISEDKMPPALEAGANECLVWDREATVDETVLKTTRKGARMMDAVINFVGSAKTTGIAMKCLQNGGIVVTVGLAGGSLSLPVPSLIIKGITLTGIKTSSLGELKELVELVTRLGLKYPELRFIPLEEVNDALNELEAGTMTGRTILKFNKE